jgi:hypothetical protein
MSLMCLSTLMVVSVLEGNAIPLLTFACVFHGAPYNITAPNIS